MTPPTSRRARHATSPATTTTTPWPFGRSAVIDGQRDLLRVGAVRGRKSYSGDDRADHGAFGAARSGTVDELDDRFPFATAHRVCLRRLGTSPLPAADPTAVGSRRPWSRRAPTDHRWLTDGYTHKVGDRGRSCRRTTSVRLDGGSSASTSTTTPTRRRMSSPPSRPPTGRYRPHGARLPAVTTTGRAPASCSTGSPTAPGLEGEPAPGDRDRATPPPLTPSSGHRSSPKTGTVYRWYDDRRGRRPPALRRPARRPPVGVAQNAPLRRHQRVHGHRSGPEVVAAFVGHPHHVRTHPRCSMASTLAWNNFRPAPAATTPSLRWPVGRCA